MRRKQRTQEEAHVGRNNPAVVGVRMLGDITAVQDMYSNFPHGKREQSNRKEIPGDPPGRRAVPHFEQ